MALNRFLPAFDRGGSFCISMFLLHRGVASPLGQKTELEKEWERRKLSDHKKGIFKQQKKSRTELEERLDERNAKVAAVSTCLT